MKLIYPPCHPNCPTEPQKPPCRAEQARRGCRLSAASPGWCKAVAECFRGDGASLSFPPSGLLSWSDLCIASSNLIPFILLALTLIPKIISGMKTEEWISCNPGGLETPPASLQLSHILRSDTWRGRSQHPLATPCCCFRSLWHFFGSTALSLFLPREGEKLFLSYSLFRLPVLQWACFLLWEYCWS